VYDLWDEIAHRKHTSISQYVIHHVLVLSILGPCVVTGRFTSIAITGLMTEFHNVFLHSRIVVSFYGYDQKIKLKNSLGIANLGKEISTSNLSQEHFLQLIIFSFYSSDVHHISPDSIPVDCQRSFSLGFVPALHVAPLFGTRLYFHLQFVHFRPLLSN